MFRISNIINELHLHQKRQRGAALMVMLVILILGGTAMLLSSLNSTTPRLARDKVTADALVQAKEALIGYAANANTPGQLPCPENTNLIGSSTEGTASSSCTLPKIGRLPWRTLGIGSIRDGNGELLWYVISPGFRTSPINSDTPAQLTVDGIPNSAVAIIFSAGPPINGQTRPIPTDTSPPVITQYLELSNNDGDDTFISNGSANIFNDRLLLVTHNDLFRVVEKRVAAEVKQCLNEYSAYPQNSRRYPWPAKLNPLAAVSYNDTTNQLFGRIPDTLFSNTCLDSGGYLIDPVLVPSPPGPPVPGSNSCNLLPTTGMNNTWTGACTIISSSGWWLNWKEMVFFGIADSYKPTYPLNAPSCGTCISVNPPSANVDKKFVVIVAGKKLTGQARSTIAEKGDRSNYLEGINANGATPFEQKPNSPTFNDTVVFQ